MLLVVKDLYTEIEDKPVDKITPTNPSLVKPPLIKNYSP